MKENDRELIRTLAVLSTVGLTLVFATVIGLFIGIELDKVFNTSPWLTAMFFLFGLAAGFMNLFKYVKKSQNMVDEKKEKK